MHHGSCLCGAVTFDVEGDLPEPDGCHCTKCRKQSGHFFVSTDVPRSAVTIRGEDSVSWYRSSEKARRGFCSKCGSSLFWDPLARDWIGIAMGAFDGPTATRIRVHVFVADKGDYYDIADARSSSTRCRPRRNRSWPGSPGLQPRCGVARIRSRACLRGASADRAEKASLTLSCYSGAKSGAGAFAGTMIDIREVKGAAAGAAATAVYMALVLISGRVDPAGFAWLLATYVVIAAAIWALLGGLVVLARMPRQERAGGQSVLAELVRTMARDRWQRDRCVSWIWPPLLFASLLASFNAFKQMILPLAGFGADPMLAAADKELFLGVDPWRVTHAILGSPQITLLIDRAYHGWFVPMSIGVVACAWMPSATFRLRTQYLLSYICVWIGIGSILAFLLPSAGPCFYEQYLGANPSFRELLDRLGEAQTVTGAQLTALSNQAMLVRLHGSEELVIGGGISAMPSVHNALAALFALAAFQLNRTAGIAVGIYAAMIWVGSIHLGWHYALDGLVAFALTYGIWIACGKVAAALDPEAGTAAPAAALA